MKYLKLFEQDFDDPFGEETYRVFSGKYDVEGTFYVSHTKDMSVDKIKEDLLGYHEFTDFDTNLDIVEIHTFKNRGEQWMMIETKGTIIQTKGSTGEEWFDSSFYKNSYVEYLRWIIEKTVDKKIQIEDVSFDVEVIYK